MNESSQSNRCKTLHRYLTALCKGTRHFAGIAFIVCLSVNLTYRLLNSKSTAECVGGETIDDVCTCAQSILEVSIEYCRDLNKEEDCHEESKIYSYSRKTCMACAEDQVFDRKQGKCVGCPEGLVVYGNKCVTPKDKCNSQGEMYNGSECVACAADHKLIGNECVKIKSSTPAALKKNSHMAIIIGIALAVVAVLAVVIVVVGVQRRKNQGQFIELKGIKPSAQGGEGQIENTLALNYKFDE